VVAPRDSLHAVGRQAMADAHANSQGRSTDHGSRIANSSSSVPHLFYAAKISTAVGNINQNLLLLPSIEIEVTIQLEVSRVLLSW
jgi:hypothetical protein